MDDFVVERDLNKEKENRSSLLTWINDPSKSDRLTAAQWLRALPNTICWVCCGPPISTPLHD